MDTNKKLNFGKYSDYTVDEIFVGWSNPSLDFFHDYIKHRFSKSLSSWSLGYSDKKEFKVTSFEFFEENGIRINLELKISFGNPKEISPIHENDALINLNIILKASESYPDKMMFGSANDFILNQNKENNKGYIPFSDFDYIRWCIEEHEKFYIHPSEMEQLENKEVNLFYGVELQHLVDNSYKWTPIIFKKKLSFSNLKEINKKKHQERIADVLKRFPKGRVRGDYEDDFVASSSSYDEHQCYFGSQINWAGDDLTDDIINDAFEGDPDNYWNID